MALVNDYSAFLTSFNSNKFQKLRDAQKHILERYPTFEAQPDVGIELPTGAGKTLIALLIVEAWRQAGKKCAILSANKTLARQMAKEAEELHIPAALMEGARADIPSREIRAYQRSNKVGIMNYWVYFNQNPAIDPADLLVMDDAHLAEHCLHSLFSVQIDAHRHEALFKSVASEIAARFPEYTVVTDALAKASTPANMQAPFLTPPELLSFLDQASVADRVREIIDVSPALKTDGDLSFRWRRLRNNIQQANWYFGLDQIWIRPYIYPLTRLEHYQQATQRIYVSATIGDPGDLSRRLGVQSIAKIPVDSVHAEKTAGRRMIVMNRLDDEKSDIQPRVQAALLTALAIHPKSVWLCSSQAEADKLSKIISQWLNNNSMVGHETWVLTALGDEIDQFKAASKGHLFVGGRFDGMDFRANECRLVILTTLPRAINLQEEFISAYLRDAGFMRRRLNQRIVQALGRCNRDDSDFGIYVLADRRFATHFGRDANREGIPTSMVAEIDMAQDQAEIEEAELCDRVKRFLNQDFNAYDSDLKQYRGELPVRQAVAATKDSSADEVLGWTKLFASQNYELAADHFEECWDVAASAHLIETGAFWKYNWSKAFYLQSLLGDSVSGAKSIDLLKEAVNRGGQSSWFNRLRASINRHLRSNAVEAPFVSEYAESLIRSFDDHLEKLGTRGNRFESFCSRLTQYLKSEKHDEFCEGLELLGNLLGYQAARPKGQAVADTRWRATFGNFKEVVTFEAKVEQTDGSEITPYYVGQAHNQVNRAQTEYAGIGYTIHGTIVTHLKTINPAAKSSIGGIRIIEKDAVQELWVRVKLLISTYRDNWSMDDISARFSAATALRGKLPKTGWFSKVLSKDHVSVNAADLLSEWSA